MNTPQTTLAQYRQLRDSGAGPASSAAFANLSPADQATARAENIAMAQAPLSRVSRFD